MHIKLSSLHGRIITWYRRQPSLIQTVIFVATLSMPVVLYCLPLLLTGGNLAPGDADYLMQTEEAMYQSLINYGQFPWWNPWVSGGVPLFANPQFGLISLPTLCSLLFGATIGYKVALCLYLVAAFWGIYLLARKALGTPHITAVLLAYIWAFSGFFALRIAGHFTFFTIVFFPFMLFVLLKRENIKHAWLYLGLTVGLMINAAAHNTSIMALAVFSLFVLYVLLLICIRIYRSKNYKQRFTPLLSYLRFLALSAIITVVLAGPRLFYSFEYIKEYPRALFSTEQTIGVVKGLFAIFGPLNQYRNQLSIPEWSWMEVGAYIGVFTSVAALLCVIGYITHKKGSNGIRRLPLFVTGLGVMFFLFGLGIFAGKFSPYYFLHQLPIFSGMRVATRWFVWTSLMVLLFIALYNNTRYRKIINVCLSISVIELFVIGAPQLASPYIITPATYQSSSVLNEQAHYDVKRYGIPYDENLTATTRSNIGQVIAGDALLDTRQGPPVGISTIRCDSDHSCPFVLTDNATVSSWSPNKITLTRTAPGSIKLNMNPGKYWLVNNEYVFAHMRLAEPSQDFLINNSSSTITIKLQPRYSLGWVAWKLTK